MIVGDQLPTSSIDLVYHHSVYDRLSSIILFSVQIQMVCQNSESLKRSLYQAVSGKIF